jgi:hypothetical protein
MSPIVDTLFTIIHQNLSGGMLYYYYESKVLGCRQDTELPVVGTSTASRSVHRV